MPLAIATTTGTEAPPVPLGRTADGSVAETATTPAQGALRDLDTGLNLAQELNDWIAVLTEKAGTTPPLDPWAMKLAVFQRLSAQIAATAELTATRVVPAP
jgi:hypothetical protein